MARASQLTLAALLFVGCGVPIVRMPTLTTRGSYDVALEVAGAQGYEIALAQPNQARLGLIARYSDEAVIEHGTYRIAITCNPRSCDIRPIGPRVEWHEQRYHMPGPFRDELVSLRRSITAVATSHIRR